MTWALGWTWLLSTGLPAPLAQVLWKGAVAGEGRPPHHGSCPTGHGVAVGSLSLRDQPALAAP